MPAPRVRPHVCHSCRRGGGEHGPYWESAFHYPDGITGAELRLYTCRDCFANQLNHPDSPFALREAELLNRATSAEHIAAEERVQLAMAIEKLKALQAERALRQDGLTPQAIAEALEERWGTPPASWRERQGVR